MRKDEFTGEMVPSTLGEYRDLCAAINPDSRAVQYLDWQIGRYKNGRDEKVVQADSQMRYLLMPWLVEPKFPEGQEQWPELVMTETDHIFLRYGTRNPEGWDQEPTPEEVGESLDKMKEAEANSTISGPREYTMEETREQFLRKVWTMIDFWEKVQPLPGEEPHTLRSRMEGLAFSILSTLDGSAIDLPSFMVVAIPAEEDKEYLKENGENWFRPVPQEVQDQLVDIGGGLHELFNSVGKKHGFIK